MTRGIKTSPVYDRNWQAIFGVFEDCSDRKEIWGCEQCRYKIQCDQLIDKYSEKSMGRNSKYYLSASDVVDFIFDFYKMKKQ